MQGIYEISRDFQKYRCIYSLLFKEYMKIAPGNLFPGFKLSIYSLIYFLILHKISKIYLYINTVELPQQNSLQATRSYADRLKTNYISIKSTKIYLYISAQSIYHSTIAYRQLVLCRLTKDKLSININDKIFKNLSLNISTVDLPSTIIVPQATRPMLTDKRQII